MGMDSQGVRTSSSHFICSSIIITSFLRDTILLTYKQVLASMVRPVYGRTLVQLRIRLQRHISCSYNQLFKGKEQSSSCWQGVQSKTSNSENGKKKKRQNMTHSIKFSFFISGKNMDGFVMQCTDFDVRSVAHAK